MIIVGENIRIIVNRIAKTGGQDPVVSIGIEAPPDIPIDRAEVRQRIQAAKLAQQN